MFFPDYVFRFLLFSQLSTVMLLWAVNANDHCPDSFDCGSLGTVSFPFTKAGREDCGSLAIHGCDDDMQQFHFINITGKKFQVTKIEQRQKNVYIIDKEFMPNGSLEKFIQEENFKKVGWQLDCKTLYDITIGVARGLDYLHKGCNTRILHLDMKPHNILLDEDFSPKISDFGLAKICLRKESIVSITCARGTIGYIAPEVLSRNFRGVSHKADVYSYEMMVLEMVGGRDNKNVQVDCSSDLYFPHWIYKRLEQNQDFGLRCIKNEMDRETVKKMTLVSLWCIQTGPSCRPSMSKVVEMLEGSLESLELPPKPFLRSSPTSLADYSTQTAETL